MTRLSDCTFVDCNCMVGVPDAPLRWAAYTAEEMERTMDRCGVEACYAAHHAALSYHPTVGNAEIGLIHRAHPRIRPAWVVMPNQTGEFLEPQALTRRMAEENIRLVRLCPRYNTLSYSLAAWHAGPMLEALARINAVVLLDFEQSDWEGIRTLCLEHPDLRVVVTNLYYRHLRYAAALLPQLPNLYLDTSGMKSFGALAEMCRIVGAHKLLFGSGAGELCMGSAVSIVRYAGIAPAEKQRIASLNLLELLEGGR